MISFFAPVSILLLWDFFSIFCKNMILGFQGFIVKNDDIMGFLSLPKKRQITLDRSHEI